MLQYFHFNNIVTIYMMNTFTELSLKTETLLERKPINRFCTRNGESIPTFKKL